MEQRIANYGISRGTRISENISGILAKRWRCFKVPFLLHPSKVKIVTMGAVTLHKWLRADASSQTVYCLASLTDRENPDTGEIITGSRRDNSERHSFLDLQPSTTKILLK